MSSTDWDAYHNTMAAIREAALYYAAVHDQRGPDRNLAWHNLLEAAMDYTAARSALLDGIQGADAPSTPRPTPTGVSRTHCIK